MAATQKLLPPQKHFHFRAALARDLSGFLDLIRIENWFMLERNKLDIVFQEKMAFLYVIVDTSSHDRVVGIGNIRKTREQEAVLANIIVRREYRRQGLGTFLLCHLMSLHDDLILTWFSTADDLYLNLGCQRVEQAGFSVRILMHRERVDAYVREKPTEERIKIVFFAEDRTEDLVRYDAQARGYESGHFLSLVTRTSGATAMAVRDSDQSVVGYAAIVCEAAGTLFFNGFYADDDRIAGALLKTALDVFPGKDDVRYYTLYGCRFLLQFRQPTRQSNQDRFAKGGVPVRIPDDKLYCLTEPDLSY